MGFRPEAIAPRPRSGEPRTLSPIEKALELERSGKWREAVEILETAIHRTRAPAPLFNRLAIFVAKYQRDFLEAERLLNRALELEPDNAVYEENLVKVVALASDAGGHKASRKRR